MLAALLWWLMLTLLGGLTFPLAFRLLPALPGRGYAFSRALGWLLWGYLFWLLATLGVLRNEVGGLLVALALLLTLAAWAWRTLDRDAWRDWWRTHRRYALTAEAVFLAAFVLWAVVRAAAPEIVGTEKPMELAFINAILRSPTFPPHDPWLSGYAISYYYFGYVLVAMLAKLIAVPGGVAFNLGLASVFALAAVGAYGVLYDLLAFSHRTPHPAPHTPLLAPLFLLLVGNLEGVLEVLHRRGLFWSQTSDGAWTSPFWTWLGIKDLVNPPTLPLGWMPARFWWWWRASRVIQDYDLAGQFKEVIDEFPAFSFLLGDLHPHVLALPFALLCVGLALHLFLDDRESSFSVLGWTVAMPASVFALAALVLGGMAFLNTWDFPIYVGLFSGVYVWKRARLHGWSAARGGDFFGLGLLLGVVGGALYLPFYLGFSSQASGLLPNLVYPSRGAHLWVMFGSLWLPLVAWLTYRNRRRQGGTRAALLTTLGIGAALWAFSLLLGALIPLTRYGALFLGSVGARDDGNLLWSALARRMTSPWGGVWLLALLFLALRALWPTDASPNRTLDSFPLILALMGALLVLAPEFVYLLDQFGTRMNTVFKFYYQAWMLWSLAAAYGAVMLSRRLRGGWLVAFQTLLTVVTLAGGLYTAMGVWDRTHGFRPPNGWTLDGTRFSGYLTPDDQAAVDFLQHAEPGVIAEAVGGSYTQYARISTHTGLPTVLGWPGHEVQWRGGAREMGSRESDIATLYSTPDWRVAEEILHRYHVRYVYLGPLERQTYQVSDFKFRIYMKVAFQQGEVTVYEVP